MKQQTGVSVLTDAVQTDGESKTEQKAKNSSLDWVLAKATSRVISVVQVT